MDNPAKIFAAMEPLVRRYAELRRQLLDAELAMYAGLGDLARVVAAELDDGYGGTVADSDAPQLVDEGAFHKPADDPELPAGARLYEMAPGVFLGIGPKGEQFSGARDSVLAALKGGAS